MIHTVLDKFIQNQIHPSVLCRYVYIVAKWKQIFRVVFNISFIYSKLRGIELRVHMKVAGKRCKLKA